MKTVKDLSFFCKSGKILTVCIFGKEFFFMWGTVGWASQANAKGAAIKREAK